MSKSYQNEYRDNMSDEQKQKLKHYKKNRDNMSDEQKQKLKDYQKNI